MSNNKSGSRLFYLFLFAYALIFTASCTTTPEMETEQPQPAAEKPAEETPLQPAPEQKSPQNDQHKVSEAVYTKTFSDIEALIDKLNKIIKASDFDSWKKYLTKEYIEYYSSQENLRIVSETPTLKKYRIVVRSLRDYFTYVVVPSRSDVKLDDISFIDDNNVKAYMQIDGEPVVLYTLINIDGNWKIGL